MNRIAPLVLLVLAGCPDPKPPEEENPNPTPEPAAPASFAEATDAQRAGALQNALGFGGVYAVFAQFQADADARSVNDDNEYNGCPSYTVLEEEPLTVRYAAEACTAPSGARYTGTLEANNPLQWEDVQGERSGATKLVADAFTIHDGVSATVIDGTWSQSELTQGVDATTTFDLTTALGGQTWRLAGTMAISWEAGLARTTCADGLAGEVVGLGSFDVSCDVLDLGGDFSDGFVELVGEDTLRVDLTPDEDGCFPATIDGQATDPICLGGEGGGGGGGGGGELDGEVFGGSGLGCADTQFFLDAQTMKGEAAGVEIHLAAPDSDDVEVHGLSADPVWTDDSFDGWSALLTAGAYEAGVGTAVSCEDAETLHAVFMAYDEDGAVIGCQLAGFARDAGPIDLTECPRL